MKVRSQWRVSRFLISSLSDYEKAGPLVAALTEYNDELFPREIRPCLDVLDQIHAIIRTEYLAHERKNAFDAQRGLRRAFSFFFANHKNIKACLSCDVIRADMCGDGKGDTKDRFGCRQSLIHCRSPENYLVEVRDIPSGTCCYSNCRVFRRSCWHFDVCDHTRRDMSIRTSDRMLGVHRQPDHPEITIRRRGKLETPAAGIFD